MKKIFVYKSCRVQSLTDGNLDHDLEDTDEGDLKVTSIFFKWNPHFWPRKWKERKILRSDMFLGQGHDYGYGHRQNPIQSTHLNISIITYTRKCSIQ